jgi:hypothetical protein
MKDYTMHSAGANGNRNQLFEWVVHNNGDYFEAEDWGQLTKMCMMVLLLNDLH